jgi:hypothetical protein
MDDRHHDAFGRRWLFGIMGGSGALAIAALVGDARAKKRRRKRRRKKKKAPTCADLCPASTFSCFNRPFGPPLCGNSVTTPLGNCDECSSDQSCIDSTRPYCITSITNREDNITSPIGACGPYPNGVCADVSLF